MTPPTTPRRRRLLLLAVPLLLLLSACAEKAPQDTLEPEGPIAEKIDNLVDPVFLVAGAVFVFVEFGVLFLVWRFRRHHTDDDSVLPEQTHGNTKLEIGWTIAPAVILVLVAIPTFFTTLDLAEAEPDAMNVDVYGQQWWWSYEYDTTGDDEIDIVTANDLVIPVDRPVELAIHSRDVIHSWWAPKLTGKRDAVPGRVHPLTFEADEPGTYVGQCTEFCGLSHSYMRIRVIALPQAEFDAWVDNQLTDAETPTSGLAAAGAEVFTAKCSSCHLVEGVNDEEHLAFLESNEGRADQVAGIAPDLTHFATRGTFAGAIFDLWVDTDGDGIVEQGEIGGDLNVPAIEAWLRDPPGSKPMAADDKRGMPNLQLPEDEINELVAFLETLD